MNYYAPNKEDEVICKQFHFYNKGRFIDIGSYDPFLLSTSRALIDRGFGGVYLHPFNSSYVKFKNQYKAGYTVSNYNYTLGLKDETKMLPEPIIEFNADGGVQATRYTQQLTNIKNANWFLNQFGAEVDYLSINLHKQNLSTLNLFTNDFLHRLKVICIAHDNLPMLIEERLLPFGFKTLLISNQYLVMSKQYV